MKPANKQILPKRDREEAGLAAPWVTHGEGLEQPRPRVLTAFKMAAVVEKTRRDL